MRADVFGRQHEIDPHDRLAKFLDLALIGHLLRRVDLDLFAVVERDLVRHVRRGLHQVDVGVLLQPLLDDLHVQQAQKAAAESEAQRVACLRLELEAGIVDRELFQGIAELLEILAVRRIEPAEHHPLRLLVTGQCGSRLAVGDAHRIADVNVSQRLDVANDVADLAGREFLAPHATRRELAQLDHLVRGAGLQKLDLLPLADCAVHHPDVGHRAAILVVHRVEHHRLQRSVGIAGGRRHALDHGLE